MPDYYSTKPGFSGKKVVPKYKPAKGNTKSGEFDNRGRTKPATKKKVGMVDKKVKKISNKVMKLKGKKEVPGPAAHSQYGGNNA